MPGETLDERIRAALRVVLDREPTDADMERAQRSAYWTAERARQADPEDIRLFHGHHPNCPYTIEGDWSVCGCGARQADPVGLREAAQHLLELWSSDSDDDLDPAMDALEVALSASLPAQPVEPPNREKEAYDAGRLAGYEEGLAAQPVEPCPRCGELRHDFDGTHAYLPERAGLPKPGSPEWKAMSDAATESAQPVEPGPLDVRIHRALMESDMLPDCSGTHMMNYATCQVLAARLGEDGRG